MSSIQIKTIDLSKIQIMFSLFHKVFWEFIFNEFVVSFISEHIPHTYALTSTNSGYRPITFMHWNCKLSRTLVAFINFTIDLAVVEQTIGYNFVASALTGKLRYAIPWGLKTNKNKINISLIVSFVQTFD